MVSKKQITNEFEKEILEHMEQVKDWKTVQVLADELEMHWNTVAKYVGFLEAKGFVEKKELGRVTIFKIVEGSK